MNAVKLREKSNKELNTYLHELLREQFNLRMQKKVVDKMKTHRFSEIRRTIARIKTVILERKGQSHE